MFGAIQFDNGKKCGALAQELLGLLDHLCLSNRQLKSVLTLSSQGQAS
jgi:hypothetical protein